MKINKSRIYFQKAVGFVFNLFLTSTNKSVEKMKNRELCPNCLVNRSLDFIKSNFNDENFTIKSVSDRAGITSDYYGKLFKNHTGMSFNKYVNNLRIENAKNLLKKENPKKAYITKIALECGYRSYTYFVSVFKSKTGKSPTQHIKSVSNKKISKL